MYNPSQWRKNVDVQKEDLNLKKIVTKNIEKMAPTAKKPRPDLVDNFHWVIMRFRRQRKLTREQFAKEIGEPVSAVIMAEQGILPEKDYVLVRKIENFLGISLIKDELAKRQENPVPNLQPKTLKFELNATKELTIADLRRISGGRNSPDVSRIKERKEFELSPDTDRSSDEEAKEDNEKE